MTFTLSGSVITQSGTDASLSGLTGIAGVTVTGSSAGKLRYLLSGLQLVSNGSLIIDPDVECLEFDSSCSFPHFTYGGKLQIGRKRASAAEISTISCVAATNLAGKHFTFNDGTTSFYVWFTVGGIGSNPNPGGTGIAVALISTDTSAQVATKVFDAISIFRTPVPLIDVTLSANVVTLKTTRNLNVSDATSGTSSFTVTITQQGSTDGRIRYSSGDAIVSNRGGTSDGTDTEVVLAGNANGNAFVGYGGRIASPSSLCLMRGANSFSGSVLIESLETYMRRNATGSNNSGQVRIGGASGQSIVIFGMTLDCAADDVPSNNRTSLVFPSTFTSFSGTFKAFNLQTFASSATDLSFVNLAFAQNYRSADISANSTLAAPPVWTLVNTDVGTATRIAVNPTLTGRQSVIWQQEVNVRLVDISNLPITTNALVWLTETNDGMRFNPFGRSGFDWTTVQAYSQAVNASGVASVTVRTGIGSVNLSSTTKSFFGKSSADDFDIYAIGYLYAISVGSHILRGNNGYSYSQSMVTDSTVAQPVRSIVDAYATINTSAQFYDRAKSWLVSNYSGQTALLVTREGDTINAGSRNVVIDASAAVVFSLTQNTITIKSQSFVGNVITTGTITLVNGAMFTGTRSDANGILTTAKFAITGIVPGSRLLLRLVSTSQVIVNEIVGNSFMYAYTHNGTDLNVEILLRRGSTQPFFQQWQGFALLTSLGGAIIANQQSDE